MLVGALAWCFAVAEFAEYLGLSREMGALIAGVSLSTFPYALDVTAKVTSLRDFFITLFFVALGMTIPLPTAAVLGLALVIVAFTLVSRFADRFSAALRHAAGHPREPPAGDQPRADQRVLAGVDPGRRAVRAGQPDTASAASSAFVMLAVLSTFVIMRSDAVAQRDRRAQAASA